MNNRLFALLLTLLPVVQAASVQAEELPAADTTVIVDRVQVTAIKQGMALRSLPVASAIVGSREIERQHVDALQSLSETVPNL
ncbi:MAG: TonB-dependent receptor, partial [Alistipes sp.]|nr:TonB-dependent receptor [Alistipes sp.]